MVYHRCCVHTILDCEFLFQEKFRFSQGTIDLLFSSYLVKHVATGEETGWLARFESLGDFGDKWQESSQKRQEKAAAKAKSRASAKADSEDKPKAKAKAKAKESESTKEESEDYMNRRGDVDWSKDLAVIITTLVISILIPYGFIAILVTTLLLVHQLLLRLIFTGPEKRSLHLTTQDGKFFK